MRRSKLWRTLAGAFFVAAAVATIAGAEAWAQISPHVEAARAYAQKVRL